MDSLGESDCLPAVPIFWAAASSCSSGQGRSTILGLYSSVAVHFPSFFQQKSLYFILGMSQYPPLPRGVRGLASAAAPAHSPTPWPGDQQTHPPRRHHSPPTTPHPPPLEPYVKHLVSGLMEGGSLPRIATQNTHTGEENISLGGPATANAYRDGGSRTSDRSTRACMLRVG